MLLILLLNGGKTNTWDLTWIIVIFTLYKTFPDFVITYFYLASSTALN